MKTTQLTAGRDAQRTAPANSRAAAQTAAPPQVMSAGAESTHSATAPPPQPNWTRYADSRLRQFYCR